MIDDWANPLDFQPGDKVLFLGMKAKVVDGFDQHREIAPWWAVPIEIKGQVYVTIAHVDNLTRRGKKK